MTLTPLHLALGESEGPLSLEMVRRACEEAVPESERLEWKRDYPLTETKVPEQRDHEQSEMAKDIAAMANGQGGLVVYGVDETRKVNTSHASAVVPVGPVDARKVRTLKQVASNLIYPPVVGLDVAVLDDDSGDTVVAVTVPASQDAPHLIRPKNSDLFGVPWRNGEDTDWMVERQIESAYRARFDQRRQRDADLNRLFDETVAVYTDSGSAWLVVVASPAIPRPARQRMSRSTASYIFDTAWGRTQPDPHQISPEWMLRGALVRPGLRRFRQIADGFGEGSSRVRGVAELHNDGSVAFAMTRGNYYGPNDNDTFVGPTIGDTDVDDACEAVFHLLWLAAERLGVNGDYELKLAVNPPNTTFRRRNYRGGFDPVRAEHQTPDFLPVLADIPTSLGRDQTAEAIVDVARDARHQTDSDTMLSASKLGLAIDLAD